MRIRSTCSALALFLAVVAAGSAGAPLAAQDRSEEREPWRVPPGHLPPPGECRIWYPDRPPGQQPPPLSCDEAEERAPHYARVIYGGNARRDDWVKDRECDLAEWRDGLCDIDERDYPRGGAICVDRNRDGRCDNLRRDPDMCFDRDRDGRCDRREPAREQREPERDRREPERERGRPPETSR